MGAGVVPGERDADRLIGGFRIAVGLFAAVPAMVFQAPAAIVVAVSCALGFAATRFAPLRRNKRLHDLVPLLIDLASVIVVLGVIEPFDVVVWPLLLLPVTEAAVRFQLVGAISTWLGGWLTISALVGWQFSGSSLASQTVVASVTVAVGLVAWQLEQRLHQVAHARRESDHRAGLLAAVANAARTVTALEPMRVLEAVTEAALVLGFDMAEIAVAAVDAGELQPVVQRGWPEHHPPTPQRIDEGVAGRAYTSNEIVLVEDYQGWEHAVAVHLKTGIARSAAAVPIVSDNETVAVLCVANREVRTVTEYERDCLDLLATQAGVALKNARIHDERRAQQNVLQHQATHDALTGLANRAALIEEVRLRLETPIDVRSRVTVLFIDLDGFKEVNDTMGHAAGDEVLVAVAERLLAGVRPTDIVARYGGDEFVILLDHSPAEVEAVACRLLDRVVQPLLHEGREIIPGASVGIAIEEPGDDLDGLILRADRAMYEVKQTGRGRVSGC